MRDNYLLLTEITDICVRIVSKITLFGKIPHEYGTGHMLYNADVHVLEAVGRNPGIKVTDLAQFMGVTKGFASKMAKRLEGKQLLMKRKDPGNKKEILLELTDPGKIAWEGYQQFHAEMNNYMLGEIDRITEEELNDFMRVLRMTEYFMDKYLENARK